MLTTSSKHTLRSFSLFLRRISSVAAIAAVSMTAACDSDTIGAPRDITPMSAAENRVTDSLRALANRVLIQEGLQRTVALNQPVVVSQLITRSKGDRIEIKELGLKVDIPKNAIPRDTMTITVTALPGKMVAYDFQPHGTRFLKALEFEQDLKGTNWEKKDIKTTLWGGYFKDPSQLTVLDGKALLDELIPTLVLGKKVEFNIWHFSGYMVSMD